MKFVEKVKMKVEFLNVELITFKDVGKYFVEELNEVLTSYIALNIYVGQKLVAYVKSKIAGLKEKNKD
jgi:hypothetical protein